MSEGKMNQEIFNAIQRLKDGALKHAGNQALQDAVSVQMWLQQFAQPEAPEAPEAQKKAKPEQLKKAPAKPGRKRK